MRAERSLCFPMQAPPRKGTSVQLETLFTGQLVRLAAPHPDDHQTFARWSENDQYLRITDNDPARPVSAEAHAAWETPFLRIAQQLHLSHPHAGMTMP